MENHPIPQNVTGFQFKLIGDMTVKQFAYLAAGCILFYIFFFALPINFLLKLPLGFGSAAFGLSLAFLPVGGRSMDTMLVNFARAVLTPNQYVYQKRGGALNVPTLTIKPATIQKKPDHIDVQPKKQLDAFLYRYQSQSKNSLDEKEASFLKSLSAISNPASAQANSQKQPVSTHHGFLGFSHIIPPLHRPNQPVSSQSNTEPAGGENQGASQSVSSTASKQVQQTSPSQNVASTPLPQQLNDLTGKAVETAAASSELAKEQVLETQAVNLEQELERAKFEESKQKDEKVISEMHSKVSDLEQQLKQTLFQKEMLEKEIQNLSVARKVFAPSTADSPKTQTPNIRKIPANMGAKFGMPIAPEVANLITGIVKDPRGNILPNILVEITDKEGNPVRAFKTNTLGQFACATPLLNGVYTVLFEDPEDKHKFDGVEIVANGEIIQPLEVISIDAREELRKELFG